MDRDKHILHFDPKTVRSISPQRVEIVAGLRIGPTCEKHEGIREENRHYLFFKAVGYNDIADTLCVLTYDPSTQRRKTPQTLSEAIGQPVLTEGGERVTVARIIGKAKEEWRETAEKANPGDSIAYPGDCGCSSIKMSGDEIAALIGGKMFPCEYASGHLVDER